ncbi:MAG: host attachment protein [Planctomycetaceae bacterium]|nr:host attachment protein [Planctomycetaceae bacterium]
MTTWILVADSGRGRLFSTELPEDDWQLEHEFAHPESREPGRAGRTTAPLGRTHNAGKQPGTQSAFEPHTPLETAERERFAAELSAFVDQGRVGQRFDSLVLVAPPQFLGKLRSALSPQAGRMVAATVDKDLSQLKAEELRARLNEDVCPGTARGR